MPSYIIPQRDPLGSIQRNVQNMTPGTKATFQAVVSKASPSEMRQIGDAIRSGNHTLADQLIDRISKRP